MKREHYLFGTAAIDLGLLTGAQIGECLMLTEHNPQKSLEQVCVENGYLHANDVARIVEHQKQIMRRAQAETSLFGRLAVAMNLLTQERAREVSQRQHALAYKKRFGELAVELGHMSSGDVQRVLEKQREYRNKVAAEIPLFGTVAMKLGIISRDDLQTCMAQQKSEGGFRRIGEICVALGFLTSEDVTRVLSSQGDAPPQSAKAPPPSAAATVVTPTAPEPPPSATETSPMSTAVAPGGPASSRTGAPEIDRYLRYLVQIGASDLHMSSNAPPMIRNSGEMQALKRPPFTDAQLREILFEIAPPKARAEFDERNDTDFAYAIEGLARFRANYFVDRHGMGAVFRQIPFEILTPEQLGLPPRIVELCYLSKGLVIVTGPTGSGKSTTLAALIDYINKNRRDHLITIEDPIEFVHENKKCLINQREVGHHTKSFRAALRAALREDPDIVLVGELRDLETVEIAIETAETGHLVFATLHTTTAPSTVDRIIDQFPADRQSQIRTMLSESLKGVVAQVLCKKISGGRVAAFEILIGTSAVSNIIREAKTVQLTSVMQTGRAVGMQTMNEHFVKLVMDGIIEPAEAYVKTANKTVLRQEFKRLNIQLPLEK